MLCYGNLCYSVGAVTVWSTSLKTFEIDSYVLDALMPDLVGHDRTPATFVMYLFLWRQTEAGRRPVSLSLRVFADGTGLSKRAIQEATKRLLRRKLIAIARLRPTEIPAYAVLRPWAREDDTGARYERAKGFTTGRAG